VPGRAPSAHVRDDVAVSDVEQSDGRATAPGEEKSVLANLPRSRPQRSSPRRAAARAASTTGQGTAATTRLRPHGQDGATRKPATAKPPAPKRAKATATRARTATRRGRVGAQEAAPRQGFETDSNAASGPVQPPGGAELLGSAAEILAELAKGGLASGERLLRDVISRLPGAR
jgi:hypothetical protein